MRVRGLAMLLLLAACATAPPERVQVRLVDDEAQAVLHILGKRRAGEAIAEADWSRLFATEGYRRLKERELSMGRPFEEAAFREFVLSDALLARHDELRRTLEAWRAVDPSTVLRRWRGSGGSG